MTDQTDRSLLHEVKTVKKSRCVKSKRFQITRDIRYASKCFLIRTRTVHAEIPFFIYSALSTSLFFAVRFVVIFERLAKHYSF